MLQNLFRFAALYFVMSCLHFFLTGFSFPFLIFVLPVQNFALGLSSEHVVLLDGAVVGSSEGSEDGTLEGKRLGSSEGSVLGNNEGFNEGSVLGNDEGFNEGSRDGLRLG